MRLAEDLYVYEWMNFFDNNCNSYYIGGNVRALIDPGLKKYLPDLLKLMAEDGIEKEAIRYIINTHSHPDHFESSELFSGSGIAIAIHTKEIEFMNGPGARLYDWFGLQFPEVEISMPLDSGKVILGDTVFEIILVPGHSPGSLALYWPERKALFSGDVIFDQNVGRSDFPGGDGGLLKKSILDLSARDADYLLPGHMGVIADSDRVKRNFEMVIKNIFPYI
ncbi:MAG: MBL fold metallo-hydrolase [Syntrophales bacterium]